MNTRKSSLILAAVFLALTAPLLALTPQSGDGAEQVMAALRGGVLHPPGFPLQAWLNRLFILLPFDPPARRLALLSALAQSGTVFCIAELLRRWGASLTARGVAVAAFAFFPSVWYLAAQPEVFALANLMMAALLWQAIEFAAIDPAAGAGWRARDGVYLGGLVGLAAASHPITLTCAPAFLVSLCCLLRAREGRFVRLGAAAGTFAGVAAIAYGSLPALVTASPWPNWGRLDSAEALLRHALRVDYGVFQLALLPDRSPPPRSGLEFFLPRLLSSWNLLLLAVPLGAGACIKKSRVSLAAVAGSAIAGVVLLARARSAASPDVAHGVLERFQGVALLPLSLLAGFGIAWLGERAGRIQGRGELRFVLPGMVVVWSAVTIMAGWNAADAASDQVLERYREGIGRLLTADSLYIASLDPEIMYGVPLPDGLGARFPIAAGLISQPWYLEDVVPRIDSRIRIEQAGEGGMRVLIKTAYEGGTAIVASDSGLLKGDDRNIQLRGLLYATQKGITRTFSNESVEAVVRLCPVLSRLRPLPGGEGHFFSRALWHAFIRAYAGASQYLITDGSHPAATEAAKGIFESLTAGRDPAAWSEACGRLAEAWKR